MAELLRGEIRTAELKPTPGKEQSVQCPVLKPATLELTTPPLAEPLLGEDHPDPNARDRAAREPPRPSIA